MHIRIHQVLNNISWCAGSHNARKRRGDHHGVNAIQRIDPIHLLSTSTAWRRVRLSSNVPDVGIRGTRISIGFVPGWMDGVVGQPLSSIAEDRGRDDANGTEGNAGRTPGVSRCEPLELAARGVNRAPANSES